MTAASELVLDREVRDWVLIPLTACVMLMQLLRQYVTAVSSLARPQGPLPSRHCCLDERCMHRKGPKALAIE